MTTLAPEDPDVKQRRWTRFLPRGAGAVLYVITVIIAVVYSWNAADLVWGVWILGFLGTVPTLVAPWVLITIFPRIYPTADKTATPVITLRDHLTNAVILLLLWGTTLAGCAMALNLILGWIPLPVETPPEQVPTVVFAFQVCIQEFWPLIAVNMVHQFLPVWQAIEPGVSHPAIHSFPSDASWWPVR